MRRLLVFACAAALVAGCVPEDLANLLPTVQSAAWLVWRDLRAASAA